MFRDDENDLDFDNENEVQRSLKLLWIAPELLRKKEKMVYGTQRGDVYSFAIVAQEIAYRAYPFFVEDQNPEGIVRYFKEF